MKRYLLFIPVLLAGLTIRAQPKSPALVVGIVVDQMRNDYIYRYWNRFGKGGFKRLVSQGYYFRNAHYNYVPTYTGPGHSSIYTGATPRTHGIIANEWYVRGSATLQYCVSDTLVKTVGAENKSGKMSPRNQLSSTIGDEIKMSSNQKAKVFGVSLKDRSAILPAGHAANAAFWFDDESGNFVSSTWYLNELPQWLKDFNAKQLPEQYLKQGWSPLYPLSSYTTSIADDNDYEAVPSKKEKPVFPYDYKTFIEKKSWGIIKSTPFGNTIVKEMAEECILKEALGKDEITDLFSVSFSSTDYVAHSYGPRSVETEDIYLRLDHDIEEFLRFLDKEIGKDNYIVFLTADHGGADVPHHLTDNKIPAGYLRDYKLQKQLRAYCAQTFGDSAIIANVSNEQVYLNESRAEATGKNKMQLSEKIAEYLTSIPGIAEAYPSSLMKWMSYSERDLSALVQKGYNHKLSGDVCFIYQPAWMDFSAKGTTHGSAYNYDTHVPVIFYGTGIKKGESLDFITITQIAPTISELLKINQPNGCIAQPLKIRSK